MAEAVLEIVLEKLSSLAATELGLFLGLDGQKRKLDSMFTAIMATLQDAEEKQFSSLPVKDWLRKLKDAAYELEGIMDDCAYEELLLENQGVSQKVLCSCLSSFHPKHAALRYKIAKRMKSISERLDDIAKERLQLHLVETVLKRRRGVSEWCQTTSLITEPQVYGREKDRDQIVDFLVGDASRSEDLSVYPIVGLGGLGKTTLAKLIFNHARVVSHFELRIWVCVSEDFGLMKMTKAIIEAASGHASEDLDQEPLQRKLQDLLQSKRYLVVLDDVWDDEQENWQRLRSVLARGATGSSILVTTRLSKVAEIMGTMPSHDLSILSHNDCWELFKYQALGPNEVEHVRLEEIGKEIVTKCGGVPLAAKTLGGLLRFERREEEWLNVKESKRWSLPHNIMPALILSYLNLPIKLRQCFAYCAIFPKDKIIEKQYLIELWVANGFISSSGLSDAAESVGDRVWFELYRRSFFQDLMTDKFGKVTHFKMHDLVHDLAQCIAEEACFIMKDNDLTTLSERIQHLSHHMFYRTAIQLLKFKSLRSYVLQDQVVRGVEVKIYSDVLKCYSLRVLDFIGIDKLPSSIGDLKHLRYLNLSHGDFKTLPESLCKLFNLQTLILNDCSKLEKLPNSLSSCLKGLQQLSLDGCSSLSSLPPQIGKLTSLRSLTTYLVGKKRGFLLAELGPLKLKGDLHIMHLERVKSVMDAKDANMSIKQLNKLRLSWDKNEEWELEEKVEEILEVLQPDTEQLRWLELKGYKGVHFPQWMSSPSLIHLTDLFLHDCDSLQLPTLGKLPCLKRLIIRNMTNIESLPDCFGDLPSLRVLSIGHCRKLRCLPTSLSLSSLERLSIDRCPPELRKRCEKETGEDWPKIAHIPHMDFY